MESVFSWEHSRPIGSFTLGHSHLVGGFDIEAWLPVCDYCFSMDYRVIDTSGLVFSAYLDDLGYLPTFHFILRHFTHGYFHTFYLTRAWSSPSFILHILPWHMTSPFSRLGGDVDQSSIALVMFSYILLDFRFNIFHDGRAWQIADSLVMMLSFW